MGEIINSACICQCVRLRELSWSHFLIDFHQNGTDVRRKNPKSKNWKFSRFGYAQWIRR